MMNFCGGQILMQAKAFQSRNPSFALSRFRRTYAWFAKVAILRGSRIYTMFSTRFKNKIYINRKIKFVLQTITKLFQAS